MPTLQTPRKIGRDIGSDISIKSLKRKTKHQRRLQFNQRVKRAFLIKKLIKRKHQHFI